MSLTAAGTRRHAPRTLIQEPANLRISPGDAPGVASPYVAGQLVAEGLVWLDVRALAAPNRVGLVVEAVRATEVSAPIERRARVKRDRGCTLGRCAMCGELHVLVHVMVLLRESPEWVWLQHWCEHAEQ